MKATVDEATLTALMQSPLAQRAIAEAENERHANRRALLEKIAVAERERTEVCAAAAKPLPALRAAHAEAVGRLRAAAIAPHTAEAAEVNVQAAHDARIGRLRRKLAPLGGDAVAATRHALALEKHAAENLDEFRTVSEPLATGGLAFATQRIDRGGASRVATIDRALAELDRLALDPEASPTAIEARCDEIRAEIEAAPARVRSAERTTPENPDRSTLHSAVKNIVWKYVRRSH